MKLFNVWLSTRKPYQNWSGLCTDSTGSISHINTPQIPFSRSASSPHPFTASQASVPLLSFPKVPSRLLYTLHLTYILVHLLKNTAQHRPAKCDLTKLFFDVQDHCHTNTCSQKKLTMSFLHHSLNMDCYRSSFRSRMCSLEIRFNALETPDKLSITVMQKIRILASTKFHMCPKEI